MSIRIITFDDDGHATTHTVSEEAITFDDAVITMHPDAPTNPKAFKKWIAQIFKADNTRVSLTAKGKQAVNGRKRHA